jgi:hypothetical protein
MIKGDLLADAILLFIQHDDRLNGILDKETFESQVIILQSMFQGTIKQRET